MEASIRMRWILENDGGLIVPSTPVKYWFDLEQPKMVR